jgi:plastocyanin
VHRKPLLAVVSLIAVSALAACSSGDSQPDAASAPSVAAAAATGVQLVTLHVTDRLRFTPDSISVHPGKVRLTLVDDGSYPHNFSIPSLHVVSPTVSGNPGQTSATTTLTLTKPGTYPFVCTFRSAAGMHGEIVVK